MRIYTSYFAQIRNFKPHIIPFSTAIYPPSWYKGQVRKDKNGIYLGIEAKPFIPGDKCHNLCHGRSSCLDIPSQCAFLKTYRQQLNQLDFSETLTRFERIANLIKEKEGFEEDPICAIMVFEVPSQDCSERAVIHDWFVSNGYPIFEWSKEIS